LTSLRLVHEICQQFSDGQGIDSSFFLPGRCKEGEEITTTFSNLSAAAQPFTAQTMQETREDFRAAYSRLLTAQTTSIIEDGEEVEEEKEEEGEDEEDLSIPEGALTKTLKKGGHPISSTIEYSQAQQNLHKNKP
jgi:hypothetical protein